MRRYEVTLRPAERWFHPFERLVDEKPFLQREAIHKMRLLTDNVGLMLFEFSGEFGPTRALMEEIFGDLKHQVDEFDDRIFVYSLLIPNETVRELLRIPRDCELFLDPPMIYQDDGELRVSYIGTPAGFSCAQSLVPETVTLELERTYRHRPGDAGFLDRLTARQREIFETAVELGYYDSPRATTYAEIGERVDLAGGTVGEHLRKIEAELVAFAVPELVTSGD